MKGLDQQLGDQWFLVSCRGHRGALAVVDRVHVDVVDLLKFLDTF